MKTLILTNGIPIFSNNINGNYSSISYKNEFFANEIIKTGTDIIGYDIDKKELFSFKGISDFSLYNLKDGEEFDINQNTEQRIIELEQVIADLTSIELGE